MSKSGFLRASKSLASPAFRVRAWRYAWLVSQLSSGLAVAQAGCCEISPCVQCRSAQAHSHRILCCCGELDQASSSVRMHCSVCLLVTLEPSGASAVLSSSEQSVCRPGRSQPAGRSKHQGCGPSISTSLQHKHHAACTVKLAGRALSRRQTGCRAAGEHLLRAGRQHVSHGGCHRQGHRNQAPQGHCSQEQAACRQTGASVAATCVPDLPRASLQLARRRAVPMCWQWP